MATVVIKNLTNEKRFLRDVGTTIGRLGDTDSSKGPLETITVRRRLDDLKVWSGVAEGVKEGTLAVVLTLEPGEQDGLASLFDLE